MKPKKRYIFAFVLASIMILTLSSCGDGSDASNNIFPNIDNADIPDVLEKTVGTLGGTYFSAGITDSKDYQSYLRVTFKNTTEADYISLMEHYQSTSTTTDINGLMLFDWGQLQVTPDNDTIAINAYIK